VISKNQMFTQT